jgi:hypothetical protein
MVKIPTFIEEMQQLKIEPEEILYLDKRGDRQDDHL